MKQRSIGSLNLVIAWLLVMIAWFLYFLLAMKVLTETPAATKFDLFFGGDPPRVIIDMTEFTGDHSGRTAAHPLFVLFVNPVGVVFRFILGNQITAAAFLNSLVGALSLGLFFLTLRRFNVKSVEALLLSILMGTSTAHIFLSFLPETYSFSNLGLLAILLLATSTLKRENFPWLLVIATVYSYGISKINIVFGGLMCLVRLSYAAIGWKKKALYLVLFVISVLVVSQLLFFLQSFIYPSIVPFESPNIGAEVFIRNLELKAKPLTALAQALPHFFVYNITKVSPPEELVFKIREIRF